MEARLREPANRVAPQAVWLWAAEGVMSLAGLVALCVLAAWILSQQDGLSGLAAWLAARPWVLPAVGLVVFGVPLLVQPRIRYSVHRWEVTDEVVFTRTGWLGRRWHLIPVSRIQTVDSDRGAIERMLGLATLKIHTASHAGSSSIRGLPLDVATELAGRLAVAANRLRDDAT